MGFFEKVRDVPVIFALFVAAIMIDPNNSTVVKWVRILYYSVHGFNLFLLFLVYIDIKNKDQKEKFQFTQITSTMGALGEDEVKVINTTIKNYDYVQNKIVFRTSVLTASALLLTHYLFGWTRPLILQVYFPFKLATIHPLFRVHILQEEAKGAFARPWNMYSKIPGATLGTIVTERATTPKDIKNEKKEVKKNEELTAQEKAKKMKKRR
ncbi:hypothetical protein BCR32DRAFT_298124 [Anaeromyces robustus]|uniref:Uncharacterized protein n=1 Tax=Anaeromyces robustus TaxID=1754192 RepID=A0A1Y1VSN2_9FUNG|nr:hypothetical protein BCR32DRAFT_298124 [Anaeromyces robustus]|eukprot:ORX64312.1 hypothetical protein BCR32DRAFT_298124 [Anaeromyces robustus]